MAPPRLTRTMRILHLGKYYAPERGGIERHTQALAEYCVGHGDRVGALVHQRPGCWRSGEETLNGVVVRRVGCLAAPVYTPVSPTFPWHLSRMLHELQPQVLHLHLPNPSCFAALASPAARRLPWLVHWHADVPPDAPDWRLRLGYRAYRPLEQALLARTRAVIATSQAYLEASHALVRWQHKTRVIPLGIAATEPGTPDATAWPHSAGLRLLAVGRLSRYKGFDVLIDALAMRPHDSLLLVGDGECAQPLRAQAAARGVAERIHFTGAIDDAGLASAYASADVFVLPSRDRGEAFGLVLLEAMRAGLPVVASAIAGSGVASVVGGGEAGLLVPPDDAAALAHALTQMQQPATRQQLGACGRARWQAHFTLEQSARATRALYELALAQDAPD